MRRRNCPRWLRGPEVTGRGDGGLTALGEQLGKSLRGWDDCAPVLSLTRCSPGGQGFGVVMGMWGWWWGHGAGNRDPGTVLGARGW